MTLHLPLTTGKLRKSGCEISETKAEAGSSELGAAKKGKAAQSSDVCFNSCSSTICFSFLGIFPYLSKEGKLKWVIEGKNKTKNNQARFPLLI